MTIFDGVSTEMIRTDPFPYFVIQNALPQATVDRLRATLPPLEILGNGRHGVLRRGVIPNNEKLRFYAADVLESPHLDASWKSFVSAHLTQECWNQFTLLFRDHLSDTYPHLDQFFRRTDVSVGVRRIDSDTTHEVLIDAEITADTPVVRRRSVKRTHLDNPHKVGVAMYYLRKPDDDSVGGAFQILRPRGPYRLDVRRIVWPTDEKNFEVVEEVPYVDNTLLFFLNTPHSFHGVSVRERTPQVRYAFNLALELREPLFDLSSVTRDPFFDQLARRMQGARQRIEKFFV